MVTNLFKTKLVAFIAMSIIAGSAYAQNLNTISLGVRGGIQASSFSDFAISGKQVGGYNAGISGIFSKIQHWAIGADLNFSRAGGEYFLLDPNQQSLRRRVVHADYFRITPKAYYFFGDVSHKFRPKLMAGPTVGFLTSVDATASSTSYTDHFNKTDFGLSVGGGFNYSFAEAVWFTMDVEYYLGLTEANKIAVHTPESIKNNTLGLNIGILFGLSKLD